MVSIRRRRLLGLCSGRSFSLAQLPEFSKHGINSGYPIQYSKSVAVHPMPPSHLNPKKEINTSTLCTGSSNISDSSSSKEEPNQLVSGQEIKRRRRHRRKIFRNQEPCVLRGVYFKNNRWQAAIKVDKKQIHLGTVASQEEAARLYDRAAFMCGREPNFELSEEDKEELRGYSWDEFLTMARSNINNKKHQRRVGQGSTMRPGESATERKDHDSQGLTGFFPLQHVEVEANSSISQS